MPGGDNPWAELRGYADKQKEDRVQQGHGTHGNQAGWLEYLLSLSLLPLPSPRDLDPLPGVQVGSDHLLWSILLIRLLFFYLQGERTTVGRAGTRLSSLFTSVAPSQ